MTSLSDAQTVEDCTENDGEKHFNFTWSKEDVENFLVQSFSDALKLPKAAFEDYSKSLFTFDPTHMAVNKLHAIIRKQFNNIPSDFVYQYPSISSMADFLTPKEEADPMAPFLDSYIKTQNLAEYYIEKAKNDFAVAENNYDSEKSDKVILLTGATGFVGSLVLQYMLQDDSVKKIYCLVRGSESEVFNRIVKSFENFQLKTSLLQSDRLEALPMKLSEAFLGFTEERYNQLKEEVNIVQHCAWSLDFYSDVEFYDQKLISPFYNLLNFAYRSVNPMHVYFTSSVTASNLLGPLIEENPLPLNSRVSIPHGYSQSKFVCEVLLNYLTKEKNFPCYVARLSVISGNSESGVWKPSDIASAALLGGGYQMRKMADIPVSVNWVPVDYTAKAICEIVDRTYRQNANIDESIYNLFNRHTVGMSHVISTMKRCGMKFDVVDIRTWVENIAKDDQNWAYVNLPIYMGLMSYESTSQVYDVQKAYEASPSLRETPGFTVHLFKKYLTYWESVGLYSSKD
ncbi:male sterility protein-domain-containing protein [Sporodiniella umbellata]|nr:male sterility protein-domain-containing protein [Sporodiniella umbellata]